MILNRDKSQLHESSRELQRLLKTAKISKSNEQMPYSSRLRIPAKPASRGVTTSEKILQLHEIIYAAQG